MDSRESTLLCRLDLRFGVGEEPASSGRRVGVYLVKRFVSDPDLNLWDQEEFPHIEDDHAGEGGIEVEVPKGEPGVEEWSVKVVISEGEQVHVHYLTPMPEEDTRSGEPQDS